MPQPTSAAVLEVAGGTGEGLGRAGRVLCEGFYSKALARASSGS